MNRWTWTLTCAVLGLAMLACGLLMPVHLRAVDGSILRKASDHTPTLIDQGLDLVNDKQLGAAELLLGAAQQERVPGREKLSQAVSKLTAQHPDWQVWGGGEYHLDVLFTSDPRLPKTGSEPLTEWIIRQQNRQTVLELLKASSRPVVQELLQCRTLTNTTIFSPSQSASGQALDAAIGLCGLLLEEGQLTSGLNHTVTALAQQANRGQGSLPLEHLLLDLMSLGQRFNWSQLVVFVRPIQDAETLRLFSNLVRQADRQLPIIYAAVQLSGQPARVAKYLMDFSQTGLNDLGNSLRFGAGGVTELLRRDQVLFFSGLPAVGLDWCLRMPQVAMGLKWFLYLVSGFLLAASLHFARPPASTLEQPLQVRGIHIAREILFALGFLLVVLLLTEPFLSQESQRIDFPFRLHLPMVGSVVPAGAINNNKSLTFMNNLSLLTLLLFFVLQSLLYLASLFKLAEIRRQKVSSRIKLRLLENEDHLFDAGLYLGFVGTIISLILVSLGVIKPSLMAAYSSTSFGIIFVSIFKIFHLRPVRRRLVLESEASSPEPVLSAGTARLATTS
ncbi:MAG TPA: hypothetical protein VG146_01015 [Verrucomicrobiae bacterium]|nr:hypothetical protein [Verrucomicrobiae bacterium]